MLRRFLILWIAFVIHTTEIRSGDWPQILGPGRNGVAVGETLTTSWPESGPPLIWQSDVGDGFAGVAVSANTVILFHREDDSEIVEARAVATGQVLWQNKAECDYQSGLSSDSGPRCVPLIASDRVYTYGVQGMLRCLSLIDGKEIWRRNTWDDFGAPEGYFGAGSSPVLYQDRLIVNVGGRDGAAVVAFAIADGETLWQNFNDTASYSSPAIANIRSTPHAIVITRLNTVSFDPRSGKIQFQFPFGARGPTVNGASPVVVGNHIFVSSSYRVGSVWAEVTATGIEPQSSGEELLATQYATPVMHDDVLYAIDGRQDVGDASVCCIDPGRQEVLWKQSGFSYGTLVRVGNEFLFLTCDGQLIRFKADRERYRHISTHQILGATPRGYRLPAISNGRLYVRDDDTLKCLNISE